MWIEYIHGELYEVFDDEGRCFEGTLQECRVYLGYFIL